MIVTQNELLDALRVAMVPTSKAPDGTTVQEICTATGKAPQTVRKGLRRMLEAGSAEVVKVSRKRLDGEMNTVSAYRLK